MCVKQVMHTKHLQYLPCSPVFKCVCTDTPASEGCKSCARECEGENRFVSGNCNKQTYECQCRYPDPLTPAQRNVIIGEHNIRRTNLTRGFVNTGRTINPATNEQFPKASNMFKLTWDTDLELLARRKASLCVSDGNGGGDEIPNQGLNFAGYNGVMGPVAAAKKAISWWWGFKHYFYFKEGNFEVGQEIAKDYDCRVFTQMAWSIVSRFACAVGSCKQAKNTIVACVYEKSVFQSPDAKLYAPGPPCSGCKGAGGTDRMCKPKQGTYLCTRT